MGVVLDYRVQFDNAADVATSAKKFDVDSRFLDLVRSDSARNKHKILRVIAALRALFAITVAQVMLVYGNSGRACWAVPRALREYGRVAGTIAAIGRADPKLAGEWCEIFQLSSSLLSGIDGVVE